MISDASDEFPPTMAVGPSLQKLRVAVVYGRMPLPMTRADQKTVAHLLAYLSARGHAIDLFTLDTHEKTTDGMRQWLSERCRRVSVVPHGTVASLCGAVWALLRGKPLQVGWFTNGRQIEIVRRALQATPYDVVYTYYVRSAEVVRGLSPVGTRNRPATFLAMQLSQALNARRIARNATTFRDKLVYSIERRLLRRYEARVWRDFTRTVLIGRPDVEEIRTACQDYGQPLIDNVLLCAHGVDTQRFHTSCECEEPGSVVFSGVMGTNTNIQAVTWFVKNCWATVKGRAPGARLVIVGRKPAPSIKAFAEADPSIAVTGEVDDPACYIASATVCINPVQACAGMQNKLIEYLASAKAVVATPFANEGVGARPGEHLVEATAPAEFAEAVVALLGDPMRRKKLGLAARKFIEQHWTWEKLFERLESEMIDEAMKARGAPEQSPSRAA